jgi:hypothetical protein
MPVKDIPNVTLASVDPEILLCWGNMVRQGSDCSLLLKHSKGKITTILKSTGSRILKKKDPSPTPPISTPAEKKRKKKRGNKQKRLKALLAYHQRLVVEKGLPPSKLMLQHAALMVLPVQAEQEEPLLLQCDICDFKTNSQQEVNVHKGNQHQEQQKPVAQDEESNDDQNEIEHFMCGHCEYGTYSKHGLAVHLGIRHKEKQKPDFFHEEAPLSRKFSRCTFCRERFDSKKEFQAHISFAEMKDVGCPLCDSFLGNCYNLQEHMKEQHDRDHSFNVREYN